MKKAMKFTAAVLCMILFIAAVPLQSMAIDNYEEHQGYNEQLFTSREGLTTTATLAVAQTKEGFIWIGGYGGLTRYDGKEFLNIGGAALSSVTGLIADDDGGLWISSSDYGIIKYCNNEFLFFRDIAGEAAPYGVRAIDMSQDGILYFADNRGIGFIDRENTVTRFTDKTIPEREIRDIACGKNGEVWIVAEDGKVYSLTDKVRKPDIILGDDAARCVAYDPFGDRFCIGSEKNNVIICNPDIKSTEYITVEPAKSINDFGFTSDGQIWVCSDDGVSVISDGAVMDPRLKINNSVESMIVDADGNMWFASSRQGVLLAAKGRFKDVSVFAGLDYCIVNSLLYDGDRLYIGHESGCEIINEKTYEKISDDSFSLLQNMRIRDMYMDSSGRIWVCTTGNGLLVKEKDGTEWKTYSSNDYQVIASDKFRCVIETSAGIIAGTDEGAYIIDGDNVSILEQGITDRVLCIAEANGVVYVGTDGNGIFTVKDGRLQSHITMNDGLSTMRILKMTVCSGKKGLWIATGNTLDYLPFETGKVQHAENFPAANVLDCMVTDDNTIWVLAGNGLYHASESAVLADEDSRAYRHYSEKNGIPYDITANSYSITVDDHAYLCGTGGVIWMDLAYDSDRIQQCSLIIDKVVLDGKESNIQGNDTLNIGSDVRRIEISAHMATYSQENPTMYYYLEGFENQYHYVTYQNLSSIVYTNIPGGNYVFHFGVYDPDGKAGKQEISLKMNVDYEWNEKTSTRVLIAVLTVIIIIMLIGIFFFRRSRIEKHRMERDYHEKEKEMLKKLAFTDYLTGLYNRNYLSNYDISHIDERRFPLNLVILDCNNLKIINDRYGHDKGDELLKTVAEIMRKYFSWMNSVILRLGGDEFLVIEEGKTREDTEISIELILREAGKKYIGDIPISFCYGISSCNEPEKYDIEKMVNEADEKMLLSKRMFHGLIPSENMMEQFKRRSRISREIKESIENGFKGFELKYQPIIDHSGEKIVGCEALVRWTGTQIKDSYPSEFIPILESTGDIIEVGRFVMRSALKQQKIWNEKSGGSFIMSINVSYQQFFIEGYPDEIVRTAGEYGIDPSCIFIELTESSRVQSPEKLSVIFEELRGYGFNIVLDDFGTGYASLDMLKKLPSDGIKIEHNFVRELGKEGREIDLAIISSIIGLCKKLDKYVIVEGVENEDVDEIVRSLPATYLQGYYYSKPVSAEEFEKLL